MSVLYLNCIDMAVEGDDVGVITCDGVDHTIEKRIADNIWKTTNRLTIERHAIAGTSPQAYTLTIRSAANDGVFRRVV